MDRSPIAPSDEVSLRELYLILRRGFAGIVVFSLVAGLAAFVIVSSRPVRYAASAGVQVTVPILSAQTAFADQVPQVSLGAQAYGMLARSTDVVAQALGVTAEVDDPRLRSFLEHSDVRASDASSQTRPIVNAEHRVLAEQPALAAEEANAWAEATAAAAVATLRVPLEAAHRAASEELAAREAELAAAEAAWATFAAEDERTQLSLRLEGLATLEVQNDARRVELERSIASNTAQRDLLLAVIGARASGEPAELATQLEALLAAGVLDPDTDTALRRALASLPVASSQGTPTYDVVTLVARARLDALTAELAGFVAERNQLAQGDGKVTAEAGSLRAQLADLERRAAALQRALTIAQAADARLSAVVPLLASQLGLAQSAARVVVRATPATVPESRDRLVVTLAATLVAGLLATLYVFLRAAVRAPSDDSESAVASRTNQPPTNAIPRSATEGRSTPSTRSSAGPSGTEGG